MGDLISRNGLIIRLRNESIIPFSKMLLNEKHKQILEFEDMIKAQPTAYDVEKVIQQLEENISMYELSVKSITKEIEGNQEKLSTFDICALHKNRGYLSGLKKALEIVKSGGIAVGQKGEQGMSREILFRGKRIDNGEWVEGGYAENDGKAFIAIRTRYIPDTRDWDTAEYYENNHCYCLAMIEVDPETVCQYTGLTDKNGRKIFEGDIVAVSRSRLKEGEDERDLCQSMRNTQEIM